MGNVCSGGRSSSRSSTKNSSCNGKENEVADVIVSQNGENQDNVLLPLHSNAGDAVEDLLDMGFEYRTTVSCPQHGENDSSDKACRECGAATSLALVHVESNTVITRDNRTEYIPDGPIFDEVSRLCQDICQEKLMREEPLNWVTISDEEPPIRAMVSSARATADDNQDGTTTAVQKQPVLLIITGKGISRAGVMSAMELLVSGMDQGSAQFHVKQALRRGFKVYMLDPNARGHPKGMDTVTKSMNALFGDAGNTTGPIYVLAHSGGGGQLVRYLLEGQARNVLKSRIRSICFTDSNHNIQWTRHDLNLFELLESPACLYIKNNGIRASDTLLGDASKTSNKTAGEVAQTDTWWRHRFGNVQTVWAGTKEHSLVCWTARHVIWNHFDKKNST